MRNRPGEETTESNAMPWLSDGSSQPLDHFHVRPGGGDVERLRNDPPTELRIEAGRGDAGIAPHELRDRRIVACVTLRRGEQEAADSAPLQFRRDRHPAQLPRGLAVP